MTNNLQELILDCIHELGQLTIPEIQEVEVQWMAELKRIGVPEEARMFCSEMCRLVIEKKLQKQAEV